MKIQVVNVSDCDRLKQTIFKKGDNLTDPYMDTEWTAIAVTPTYFV